MWPRSCARGCSLKTKARELSDGTVAAQATRRARSSVHGTTVANCFLFLAWQVASWQAQSGGEVRAAEVMRTRASSMAPLLQSVLTHFEHGAPPPGGGGALELNLLLTKRRHQQPPLVQDTAKTSGADKRGCHASIVGAAGSCGGRRVQVMRCQNLGSRAASLCVRLQGLVAQQRARWMRVVAHPTLENRCPSEHGLSRATLKAHKKTQCATPVRKTDML